MNARFHLIPAAILMAGCGPVQQQSTLVQPEEWWRVHPRPVYASLEKIGTYQAWFDVYRIAERTFAIYEPNQFEEALSYLVLGDDRGILIDAGTGIGDMRQVVAGLTPLPVSAILTHEHYDHVGNAHRFDRIAAFDNPAALQVLKRGVDNARLKRYITPDYLWKSLPSGFDPAAWTIPPIEPDLLLREGDTIDLGGRILEVLYTPGHSPGSLCLVDGAQRLLFTGDVFFPGPLYAHAPDVDIDQYLATIDRLAGMLDRFDYLCSGHNDPWVPSEVIPRVGEAFRAIFDGGGKYSEGDGLRRYYFEGFDVLIRSEQVLARARR